MEGSPKRTEKEKGSEMASQIAQARQSIIKKIHHKKNNSQTRNRRTTSVFWDLQNQKVQLEQQKDLDKKLKEFLVLKSNLGNQMQIHRQQNEKIKETLENYSSKVERPHRNSLITYENYDLDARVAFLEILVTKMIPAQKSQKICLKNKLEQQKAELDEQHAKIARIEQLNQELEAQADWKQKIAQHTAIMWSQVNEIIENKNLMAFRIGQIDTERYIEKKFEKYKPQEVLMDDDWLRQMVVLSDKFDSFNPMGS